MMLIAHTHYLVRKNCTLKPWSKQFACFYVLLSTPIRLFEPFTLEPDVRMSYFFHCGISFWWWVMQLAVTAGAIVVEKGRALTP